MRVKNTTLDTYLWLRELPKNKKPGKIRGVDSIFIQGKIEVL